MTDNPGWKLSEDKSPQGNYCAICDKHDSWCEHLLQGTMQSDKRAVDHSIKVIRHPPSPRRGIGSGRGSGNPGVRKAKVFSPEEIAAENKRQGMTPAPILPTVHQAAIFWGTMYGLGKITKHEYKREITKASQKGN